MPPQPHVPRLLAVPSGVTLALAEYGAPDGEPVLFFHGWPSARVQGAMLHEAAAELGVRLIAIDRPGIGASTPQRGRRLVDWPPLVRELAGELKLTRFRVLGISGGGPYALACGWALSELVEDVTVICGAPPLAVRGSAQGFNLAYRLLLAIHRHLPIAVRSLFWLLHPIARVSAPPWMLVMLRGTLVGADKAVLEDPAVSELCYAGFRHAWGEYRNGVFEDAQIYAQPWGFELEEVRVPVRIWHGTEDHNFAHGLAEAMARQIPQCDLRIVPGEGHYSLPIRRAREILAELLVAPVEATTAAGVGAPASSG